MIGRIRLGHRWEFIVLSPIEFAGLYKGPTQGRAVAGKELGRRMDDQVGPPLEGLTEIRRRKGIVDDEWNARVFSDGYDSLKIDHHAARVGQDFDEDGLGLGGDGVLEVFWI